MQQHIWTEKDSADFIKHANAFTPMKEVQHRIIADLIAKTSQSGVVLELCCGAGDLAKVILERFPEIEIVAKDRSPAMLAQTRKTCECYLDRLITGLFELTDRSWRLPSPQVTAVYSSLAIHHLDAQDKQQLFKDVYTMICQGGCFIIADLMMPAQNVGFDISAWQWDQEVNKNSQQLYKDSRAVEQFHELKWNFYRHPHDDSIDKPSSIREHLTWLDAAGFTAVDVHWMIAGHAIISGYK